MTHTISILNQKGGVAKTTTAHNLAYALSSIGQRVLVVDLDPQSSLTVIVGLDMIALDRAGKTIVDGLIGNKPASELIQKLEHFDVIPCSISLSKGVTTMNLDPMSTPHRLLHLLKPIKDDYDFILIDCQPSLGTLPINALAASESVLIPAKTDMLSLFGVPQILDTVTEMKRHLNPELRVLGVLPTVHSRTQTLDRDAHESMMSLEARGIRVFDPIPKSTEVEKAHAHYKSVLELSPTNPAAEAYAQLAGDIMASVTTYV